MSEFNPNSHDSVLSKILTTVENNHRENREAFEKLLAKQDITNGRVNGLEQREQNIRGKIWGIAVGVPLLVSVLGTLLTKLLG